MKETCPICYESMTIQDHELDQLILLRCNHLLHKACYELLIQEGHDACPSCRHLFKPKMRCTYVIEGKKQLR